MEARKLELEGVVLNKELLMQDLESQRKLLATKRSILDAELEHIQLESKINQLKANEQILELESKEKVLSNQLEIEKLAKFRLESTLQDVIQESSLNTHDNNNIFTVVVSTLDLIEMNIDSKSYEKVKDLSSRMKNYIIKYTSKDTVHRSKVSDHIPTKWGDMDIDIITDDDTSNIMRFSGAVGKLCNVFSNLMNNSIDAKATYCKIVVTGHDIHYTDNGESLPIDMTSQLKVDGFVSSSKREGKGQGMKSVLVDLEDLGMELSIDSTKEYKFIISYKNR